MTKFFESFKRFSATILVLGVVIWMVALVLGQVVVSWVQTPPNWERPDRIIHTEEIPTVTPNGCLVIDGIEVCGTTATEIGK